jgi:hypothetical protein
VVDAGRPPVEAAEEEGVAGRSEVVSRRAPLLSAVEHDKAKSQSIDWLPRWLDDSSELRGLPENAEELAWGVSHADGGIFHIGMVSSGS